MSEDAVTYSELKLPQVKEARPGKRHPTSKKRKTLCKIIVGIICFLVIVKIASIAYASFQNSRNSKRQDKNATSPGPEDDSLMPTDTGRVSGLLVMRHHCHRRHCYYLSNQEVTWKESEKLCQDMNSKLLTINDKEEQTFIQSKIKYTYWIGFCISEDKHKWKWQDGTEPAEQL
ncbi:natural killer cells antigen CD94-like [Ochotona princeps]|uniref:natural killer cells antigen CD94-like n=1 Tax=Ochotona princeps TaxID=9978 RepID=UPI0027155743|nr:natural killer cells antigen CD94-like [Ochotona princeps]